MATVAGGKYQQMLLVQRSKLRYSKEKAQQASAPRGSWKLWGPVVQGAQSTFLQL